ncbi:hypothetical protein QBC35DRAFT_458356 [Podospora australis]|uniref:Uncharacterized protein n=1 Tax=Podospora australis TaxID=1536484 RepID=A0AAN7APW7_9PEZI|nr:hypothetical protein QBC35DRAFT_458356 [Podospora australis]
MKFQALFLAALVSTGLAAPTPETAPKFAPVYTLRLSSRTATLDGKYLSTSNSTLGIFSKPSSSVKFYAVKNPQTGLSELHTYPRSASDNTLALVGTNGLLDLSSLPNPAQVTVPKGTVVDWQSFHLSEADEEAGALGYAAGKEGSWVAFPATSGKGEWTVKWKEGSAITIQNYIPVKVVYELVTSF